MRDDDLIEMIADRVEQRLASRTHRMIAQKGSPLGARTHRAVVQRRVERGEGGAAVVGKRRFLLSPEALQEEQDRNNKAFLEGRRKTRKAGRNPELDELQRELVGGLKRLREVR